MKIPIALFLLVLLTWFAFSLSGSHCFKWLSCSQSTDFFHTPFLNILDFIYSMCLVLVLIFGLKLEITQHTFLQKMCVFLYIANAWIGPLLLIFESFTVLRAVHKDWIWNIFVN